MTRSKTLARKRNLTELLVKRLPPESAPFQVWDTRQHGLALRVQPSNARSWYCVYSRHGRSRWYRLGDVNSISLADARTLAAEAMLAVARGKDPAAEKRAKRSAGTFGELATEYVEQYAKKINKSWKQAQALVRRHVLPRWGKLQAASITRGDVKALMAKIEAPILANQVLAAVSAIYTWGIKEEKLLVNPCKLVDRNPTKDRERVLSEFEIPKFWTSFDDAGPLAAAALKTLLLTGQRPGEVAHMRREHVHGFWWEMPGDPVPELGWPGTKNGQNHRVWLPQPVQALVGDGRTGFVFSNSRGGAVDRLDDAMRAICAKLGAEKATPHDLRRTHGTTITKMKFGRDAMNRIQNHIEGGIADVYDQHGYSDENKHIMEAVAAKIVALAEGRAENDNVVRAEFAR
jgi:integrase